MSSSIWIVIAAVVALAVVVLVVALAVGRRKKTGRLKQRFGPEYERTVASAGTQGAAEKELAERERRRDDLDIIPLTQQALAGYVERWRIVQTAFVDNPSSAVGDADGLVTEVMRERGYPVDDFEQRAADISVDHPGVVEDYRAAHDIHLRQERGDVGTEQQRQAFVHYRALFEELLAVDGEATQASHPETR